MSTLYHSHQLPTTSGIYRITNTVNGRFYIGSAVNLNKRCYEHRRLLNHGTHSNPKLQSAWKKYGASSFIFEVLEDVPHSEMLIAREQYWIDTLKPFFNIATKAGSTLGVKPSPETREKQRLAKLGKPGHTLGIKHSPERVEKNRIAQTGKKLSEETKRKVAETSKGRLHRPETIEKMRKTKLGHSVSLETRTKISEANTGRQYTPEVYASRMKTLIITDPNGTEYVVTGVQRFCNEHHLDHSHLGRVAAGIGNSHKGWKARFPDS